MNEPQCGCMLVLASMMRIIRACPVPDSRLLGGLPRLAAGRFYRILKARIPWWQGKMQGISPIQPFFAKIRLKNICEFSNLRDEFPVHSSRESIRASRE
jgi:hypothetical protein